MMWPTLSGYKSVGRVVPRSTPENRNLILQSTVMRVAAVVPLTSDIGVPVQT